MKLYGVEVQGITRVVIKGTYVWERLNNGKWAKLRKDGKTYSFLSEARFMSRIRYFISHPMRFRLWVHGESLNVVERV